MLSYNVRRLGFIVHSLNFYYSFFFFWEIYSPSPHLLPLYWKCDLDIIQFSSYLLYVFYRRRKSFLEWHEGE